MSAPVGQRSRRWVTVEALALAAAAIALIWLGMLAHAQVWQRTETLRFSADMENAWNWGSRAAREGYFGLYDRVVAEHADQQYGLDYSPLRLGVMTLWAKSRLAIQPVPTQWQRDDAFNAPLMHFNTMMELLSAVAIFVMAREWARRDDQRQLITRRWLRAEWLALIAAALVLFNPAVLLSAHARPTWDIWILPFYLWAIWSCGRNFWFTAGCILAAGALFKAQQLVVAPIFILWPLMRFRIGALSRFVIGFALTAGLIVSPWIVGPHAAPIAFILIIALLPLAAWLALRRWPARGWRMPTRWLRWLVPFCAAAALWLCVPLFSGSMNWFRVSIIYGSNKFEDLAWGGTDSITEIMSSQYGWAYASPVESLQWLGWHVTIADVLVACYGAALLACSWALHRYSRAGDRRFMLAMAAPWIVYFTIFPKMHERYLLWGAAAACASTIVGMGPVWLAIFFSVVSAMMSLAQMMWPDHANGFLNEISPSAGVDLQTFIGGTSPGIGWAVLLAMAVWMWMTMAGAFELPWRKASLIPLPPGEVR